MVGILLLKTGVDGYAQAGLLLERHSLLLPPHHWRCTCRLITSLHCTKKKILDEETVVDAFKWSLVKFSVQWLALYCLHWLCRPLQSGGVSSVGAASNYTTLTFQSRLPSSLRERCCSSNMYIFTNSFATLFTIARNISFSTFLFCAACFHTS